MAYDAAKVFKWVDYNIAIDARDYTDVVPGVFAPSEGWRMERGRTKIADLVYILGQYANFYLVSRHTRKEFINLLSEWSYGATRVDGITEVLKIAKLCMPRDSWRILLFEDIDDAGNIWFTRIWK